MSEAQLALLGPTVADPEALTRLVDDDPPFDDSDPDALTGLVDDDPPWSDNSEEARIEWEQVPAEWIATGFPGCDPALPVAAKAMRPRGVDKDFVIVEPDEVKTKAQHSTGRKEVWTFTAVVLVAGLSYAFAEATAEGLWLQVSALLVELGVLSGKRRLLVLGDGASWIRTWFEGLGIDPKAMILCWWHLRKRCYQQMSSAGGPKDRRRAFEKELLDQLWEGKVDAAIELLKGVLEWVSNPAAIKELIEYLEKRREYIPNYQQTETGGVMDRQHAGGEVQRLGGVGAMQASGDELDAPRRAGLGRLRSRGATVNSTVGVEMGCCRSECRQNRFGTAA